MFINETIANLDLWQQFDVVQLLKRPRLFMLARLQQIRTIAWTIERDFALLAAALRADASMHRGTKTLFLTLFADDAAHEMIVSDIYYVMHTGLEFCARRGLGTDQALAVSSGEVCRKHCPNRENLGQR